MNSLAKLALAALLLGSSVLGCAQNSAVAYTQDGALFLATDSGTVTRTLKTRIPIGDFSISRDATKVVFVPAGVDYGGTLYMVDAVTGQLEQLTGLCPVQCNGEVYSDPEFSPDGKQLVFSVHGAAHGDLVEASGPIAVMEFSGRQIRKLKSTVDIGGRGPAFANSPHWSADGKKILLNFEIGAAFTDSAGQTLRDISALLGEEWSNARGWLGTQCVIYVAGKDAKAADKLPLQVINLKTTQKQQLSDVLQKPEASLVNVIEFSTSFWASREGQKVKIHGGRTEWSIPYKPGSTFVRFVHAADSQVPAACN